MIMSRVILLPLLSSLFLFLFQGCASTRSNFTPITPSDSPFSTTPSTPYPGSTTPGDDQGPSTSPGSSSGSSSPTTRTTPTPDNTPYTCDAATPAVVGTYRGSFEGSSTQGVSLQFAQPKKIGVMAVDKKMSLFLPAFEGKPVLFYLRSITKSSYIKWTVSTVSIFMPPPSGRSVLPTFRGTALKQIPHTSANSHFGNPLTKNYVHPSSSPQPGPPPTWKPLAKFGGPLTSELPPPSTLDAEGLGHAANTAARDRVKGTSPYWQQLKDRALAIAPAMEPRDCALLLNAFSRVRLCDQQLFDTLAPVVEAKLLYFTSVHLAMVFSAFAKTGESFLSALSREVGARVHEFHSPVEICMLLNAMTKLGLVDLGLFTRWSKHVQARMSQEPFHVRDLSVIASALARVIKHHTVAEGGRQKKEEEDSTAALNAALDPLTDTMDLIAGRALATLGEATPMELARLLLAFTSDSGGVIIPPKQLLESSLECARDKLMFMAPAELVNVAFAFGQVRESLTSASDIALLDASIFERLRFSAVSSAPLFLASEVAGLLQVYSRWRIPFGHSDLAVMVSRLVATADKCDAEVACNAAYCASMIVLNTAKSREIAPSALMESLRKLLQSYSPLIVSSAATLELGAIAKFVEAMSNTAHSDRAVMDALARSLMASPARVVELGRSKRTCHMLIESFIAHGFDPEEDLMLTLREQREGGGGGGASSS
ncbi:hypothetical protein FOZ63_027863 [Perkinsus olseni]|uniref:Uncharacterized protein n=1 Tax=Perkinsus olseni TaxID=32597 RepID=A0A7J6QQ86_PEROL|nr:hypothetical protein FOZ63_027863 [Perkinsus olseni]